MFKLLKSAVSRKRVLSLLITGSLLASTASAQLTFSINTFTADELTVTISGASTLSGTAGTNASFLIFAETSGTTDFVLGGVTTFSPASGAATLGTSSFLGGAFSSGFTGGEVPVLVFNAPLSFGDSFVTDQTFSILGTGIFNPMAASMDEIGLHWGSDAGSPDNFQSTAVPEPSSYALLAGVFAAGAILVRRRNA